MTGRGKWESRLALAMLPTGGVMTLASVIAFVTVALLALDTVVRAPPAAGLLLGWCLAAAAGASRNVTKSIETMSSFEWRPMAEVAALSGVIAVTYPGWWIATA